MRKTKIVCTLGPSSSNEEVIEEMLKSGMNVARLNFSHGTHEGQKTTIDTFRRVRDRLEVPAAVLLDTKGPEIRIRDFEDGGIYLKDGQNFTLTTAEIMGTKEKVSVTYMEMPQDLNKGDKVLIDDGKVLLEVLSTDEENVYCKVVHGGKISNHKGVNLPNIALKMEYLSKQDRGDILFGIDNQVDYIAASFVRRKEDVEDIRKLLKINGGENIKIISKIENVEGIENFEEILQLSDGIMVARGDMGVEVAYEKLPGIQKRIIRRCQQAGKIVITATQMLESMIDSPVPTRAEITDVANAVFDGTSAVMLSGETAMGKYPVEAIKTMSKIAKQAEKDDPRMRSQENVWHEMDSTNTTNAVGHAACTLAKDIKAAALIAITKTGYTAVMMSKFRPSVMIIASTPYEKTYQQLALVWGVVPMISDYESELEELFANSIETAKRLDLINEGEQVVISAGIPLDIPSNTNIIKVETV
ncbi:MAG: pyruvate kinase [Anaerovoracaceae bacterium]